MSYTRAQLKARINENIHNKIGMLNDEDETMNEIIRDFVSEIDLRSAERRTLMVPNLLNGRFDYSRPADLKGLKIIDIAAQADTQRTDGLWNLVTPEEFDVYQEATTLALDEYDGIKILKVNSTTNDFTVDIDELDSTLSGTGSWSAIGDATNLAADTDNFVKGSGSLKFDLGSGGLTTAGIESTTVEDVDLTDYLDGNGMIFVWAYITSITNLTSYTLRIGDDSSNYISKTVTTTSEGLPFSNGWNLLRFNLTSYTTVGTPSLSSCTYVSVFMNKAAGKINETSYHFDWISLKKGISNYLKYYSKYGWTSSAGVYKENSTDDSDLLIADTDEFGLIVKKGSGVCARKVREYDIADRYDKDYENSKKTYEMNNPSRAIQFTTTTYKFGSLK